MFIILFRLALPPSITNNADAIRGQNERKMEVLLTYLQEAKNELRIITNNGEVHINTHNFNYTYIGAFGNNVLMHCIKRNCLNNEAEKLQVLSAHMDVYRKNVGGININLL